MLFARSENYHWSHTVRHFLFDGICCVLGFWMAVALRFQAWLPEKTWLYLPAVMTAALALPMSCYIFGLYSPVDSDRRLRERLAFVCVALALMTLVALAIGSVNFDARVGRGVQAIGIGLTSVLVLAHHVILSQRLGSKPERLACVISQPQDEAAVAAFAKLDRMHRNLVGVFTTAEAARPVHLAWLGTVEDIEARVEELDITRVVCMDEHLFHSTTARSLRALRYNGVRVTTLAQAFEDSYQTVALELVTDLWLLTASTHPEIVYIRKLKRAFDIVVVLALLLVLGPVCIMGVLLVWLTSGRPIFYRQVRTGRQGKPFEILKLRSMRTDAEVAGAQWCGKADKRVTPVGNFLRKFRVDEIPQLFNILKGEMSFVGPRPERPEFIEQLVKEIPLFSERLMLPPGLTGWAQVNYPYGASVDDARRKLEYDLYYLKHMGLLLDIFILLDTVKTVLRGGASTRFKAGRDLSAALSRVESREQNSIPSLLPTAEPAVLQDM
ncbi:MAG: sugar transferase [Verrucomicrobiaceae bacterium]|nr:sugar transferase [Verrucomicrobiaceae bacterium]